LFYEVIRGAFEVEQEIHGVGSGWCARLGRSLAVWVRDRRSPLWTSEKADEAAILAIQTELQRELGAVRTERIGRFNMSSSGIECSGELLRHEIGP